MKNDTTPKQPGCRHARENYPLQQRSQDTPDDNTFYFCRLFDAEPNQPNDDALDALARSMVGKSQPQDSNIPAGFTYLGQFIDHDITSMPDLQQSTSNVADVRNKRSPMLDLDSIYGGGPGKSPQLYKEDSLRFKLGNTMTTAKANKDFALNDPNRQGLPNDLPREHSPSPRKALIGDPRNDENLAVAQTHLAFLKLHNRLISSARHSIRPEERFDHAQKSTIQHYQSVVLHDFVKRLVDENIFIDVMKNGRKYFLPKGLRANHKLTMPIEFSVAAYRFGHSMVRRQYDWNKVFKKGGLAGIAGRLEQLFEFSAVSGSFDNNDRLTTEWIIDWRRFYDFAQVSVDSTGFPPVNVTHKIDTLLAFELSNLPEFKNKSDQEPNLALRNLARGKQLQLPSGQAIANKMGVTPLTEEELTEASPAQAKALRQGNMLDNTPLWYYILREAAVKQQGNCLGEVGSRIVIETFHALITYSPHSILNGAWSPDPRIAPSGETTMASLLAFVDDLNPLGN